MVSDEVVSSALIPYFDFFLAPCLLGGATSSGRIPQNACKSTITNIFTHVGQDCPGAIQFISEEKEDTLINQPYTETVQWLGEDVIDYSMKITCSQRKYSGLIDSL